MIRAFTIVTFLSLFSMPAFAGAVDGNWLFKKDNADNMDRALSIHASSFISLITTPEGVAYETGWWTENPGSNDRTSVIIRYGDTPPDTIEYMMDGADRAIIWFGGEQERWGTMTRINCSLVMQYRNKSDIPPEGCEWLHIRGWGYSGLDGECMYNEDWENNANDEAPMECLIEAPATQAR
jgi:hypothetical protein